MSLCSGNDNLHTWLSSTQAHQLSKRLAHQPPLSRLPANVVVLQPGMGIKGQEALVSVLPGVCIMNAYAPPNSTGLLCLAKASPSGLHLGPPDALHRLAAVDKLTGARLAIGQCGQLIVQGPTMMASSDQQGQDGWISTGDRAVVGTHDALELAYGAPTLDPLTFLEDHIIGHPLVMDCAVVLVAGRLRAFASPMHARPDGGFVQDVSVWATQGHHFFSEMHGTVTAVKAVARSSIGRPDVDELIANEAIAGGPRMGLFVNDTPAVPARRARMAAAAAMSVKTPAKSGVPPSNGVSAISAPSSAKKPVRDSKRRATHSQIERRRREKINDRLVTLRTIVPACAAEVEDRKRAKREEEEEARRIAAGEMVGSSARGKRKRNRRKAAKTGQEDKEDELGLHKLEVLTHTIDYIYQLQDRIYELETGSRPPSLQPKRAGLEDEDEDEEPDDDDEGSDAHLEMSEWKGIRPTVKRRTSEAEVGIVDMARRRSTISSDLSSLAPSPAVMSMSAESPMFSTGASSSSTSALTSLTSPMMSLSSESPIFRWSNHSSSSPGGSREKERPASKHGKGAPSHAHDWQLPGPALPLEESSNGGGGGGGGGGTNTSSIDSSASSRRTSAAQEAHLLLNLSTSPEVLRPMSAIRQTFVPILQRRKSITATMAGSRAAKAAIIGGSAPGGAHPSASSALLVSPPLLALDAPSAAAPPPSEAMELDK